MTRMRRAAPMAAALLALLPLASGAQGIGEAKPVPLADISAFGFPSPDADFETLSLFRLGNAVFRQEWLPAGDGPEHFDGLGPLHNAGSCEACHIRDGRGRPVEPGDRPAADHSMLLKIGVPDIEGRVMRPDPAYGRQLQDKSVDGLAAEGEILVAYEEHQFVFPDGEAIALRRPAWEIGALGYGPMTPRAVLSARIAPPMIGLGLLERVPDADIVALEDSADRDGDGISGRANRVAEGAIGRFGWKAAMPSVEAQVAAALSLDMGLSNPLHLLGFGDCMGAQAACRAAADGASADFEGLEAHSVILGWAVAYSQNLAVPVRRDADDPDVRAGEALFAAAGCAACHRPSLTTGSDPDQPHLADHTIAPYSDLLVHDMGADLADGFIEGNAMGGEWRTAPLWGVGLTGEVNGNFAFLHDGRARSVVEAILWHGGEAERARDSFASLSRAERDRLVAFVNSL